MDKVNVQAVGFGGLESSAMTLAMAERGFAVIPHPDLPGLVADRAATAGLIVLCAVRSEESLSVLKATMTDQPSWLYAAGLDPSAPGLLSKALLVQGLRVFLLPPDPAVLRRHCAAMKEELGERSETRALLSGLGSYAASFSWRSDRLRVTRAARWAAAQLRAFGYAASVDEEDEMALSLEEALVNSVEHGNLELDSSMRPADPRDPDVFEETKEARLKDERYGGRELGLKITIEADRATISISDQGPGFDSSLIAMPGEENAADNSGKGFFMIRRAFDDAYYGNRGRELTLVKRRLKKQEV
jgi:anti-sigma regulatory factor (Ser/Thr protein kinase)